MSYLASCLLICHRSITLASLPSSLVVFGKLRLVLKSKHQAEVLPEPKNRPRPIYAQTITNGSAPVTKNQTSASGHVTGKQSRHVMTYLDS